MTTTNASSAILIDTNVLVYVYDPSDGRKQDIAIEIVRYLFNNDMAVLSVQCLSEFYRAVTRRTNPRMTSSEALSRVDVLSRSCPVLPLTGPIAVEACRVAILHQMSIWDSMILSVAKLNQVPYILTEDSEHNRTLEGVRYLNPFSDAFNLQAFVN